MSINTIQEKLLPQWARYLWNQQGNQNGSQLEVWDRCETIQEKEILQTAWHNSAPYSLKWGDWSLYSPKEGNGWESSVTLYGTITAITNLVCQLLSFIPVVAQTMFTCNVVVVTACQLVGIKHALKDKEYLRAILHVIVVAALLLPLGEVISLIPLVITEMMSETKSWKEAGQKIIKRHFYEIKELTGQKRSANRYYAIRSNIISPPRINYG